ncbi:hypothetical protein Goklo_006409 [Gossypium klotzschianum]|uniref:Uncharacterized protein n=1 Tax=Gossypium klotzschianum TaxID=34286 RepID=A0A7J8VHH1_9ROSI|nr:hypothetical protein [Gossypium klotzschianum]
MVLIAQTILNNLKLLFDEHVKNSKSTSSSLAGSSNISDNNPIDSSLYQFNVNRVDLEEEYDEKIDCNNDENDDDDKDDEDDGSSIPF